MTRGCINLFGLEARGEAGPDEEEAHLVQTVLPLKQQFLFSFHKRESQPLLVAVGWCLEVGRGRNHASLCAF